MFESETTTRRTVVLDQQTDKALLRLARTKFDGNVSMAVRAAIRQAAQTTTTAGSWQPKPETR